MDPQETEKFRAPTPPSPISRRDFLNGMLLTGASLTLAPLDRLLGQAGGDKTDDFGLCHKVWMGEKFDLAEPGETLYDCLIIGGGISGLVAAWKLQRLGIQNILVLERSEAMGGLCRADKIGGITAARASAYASFPFNKDMLELYRDLGFVKSTSKASKVDIDPKFLLQPPYDQIYLNGKWVSEPFDEKGIARLPVTSKIRDELKALIATLDEFWEWEDTSGRSAFDCPVDAASTNQKMRRLDKVSLGEYVESRGWSLDMIKLFEPLLRSAYGVGYERISA